MESRVTRIVSDIRLSAPLAEKHKLWYSLCFDQITPSFQQPLFWMSSNVLATNEEDEKRQPASHSVREGLGDDEKIDIESQRPHTSGKNDHMASSSTSPKREPSIRPKTQMEASSNPASSNTDETHPVIINMHEPSSVNDVPDGEPTDAVARSRPARPRDSWDYHADDSFEIEKEVAISEVEQEVVLPAEVEQQDHTALLQEQPILLTIEGTEHEFKSKLHLSDDGKIDIESQRPPTGGNNDDMASSNATPTREPSTLPQAEMETSPAAASTNTGDTYPVIIDMHVSSSVNDLPNGEPPDPVAMSHPDRPGDSWNYHKDDSFEIKKEIGISEVEQENLLPAAGEHQDHTVVPQEQPILPTIAQIKNDFKSKLNLSDLILPSAADDLTEPEPGIIELVEGLEASPNDSTLGDLPVPPTSRRKPPRPASYRVKTRLQDPPPMTPAVSDQLANLWSDAGTRSRRASMVHQPVEEEGGQHGRFGPVTCRRVSMVRQPNVQEEHPHPQARLGSASGRKSTGISGGDPALGAAPTAAPSRLSMFSPSRLGLFSPSRLGLQSKSKANLVSPPEEERDPLDDDAIPAYKKKKKKQRKWLVAIQWFGLTALVIVLIFAVKFRVLKKVIWRDIALWQWLALAIVVVSGRLIAGWCVMILVALIERHYILKKRVLYFVYGLRHAVKNCIWLALVIGVWKLVFKNIEDKSNTTPIVTKVLWCLFTTSTLWMVKILAVKVAANSFHRAAYFDRVQDCLFHQYVLETLSAPRLEEPYWTKTDINSRHIHDHHIHEEPTLAHGCGHQVGEQSQQHQQQVASSKNQESQPGLQALEAQQSLQEKLTIAEEEPTQPSINLARAPSKSYLGGSPHGSRQSLRSPSKMNLGGVAPQAVASQLHSPIGRIKRVNISLEATGPIIARSSVPIGQEKLQELTSETVSAWTLKRLMKMIRKTNIATFSSILEQEVGESIDSEAQAKSAAKQIFYNIARPGEKFLSISDFLYFLPEDQATRAFGLFELNDAGHITKKSLMKWVVNVYKERRALALTLSDNRTVVAKLHRVLDVLLCGIAITICFLIMGVNAQKLLVAFSSVLLPSVFVFGNSARSTFESLIFLFVMHPFDVGDRISVDGQSMIVEEMNILNTILLSGSNEKIYYPNSMLATKAISNFYRSPDQWDSIEFQIHSGTPVEQLGLLKERMTKYIESLPQFWYPVFRIVCKDIEDSTRMKMALWVQHHLNYQESGERWQRRSNMILHMKTQLNNLGIGFHLPRQEITVTGIPILDVPAPHHATPL